ncbi:MAG: hypothetical protein ACRCTZ_14850 [Sarcina sp.]
MSKQKQKQNVKEIKTVSDQLVEVKVRWFADSLKRQGLYTKKWEEAYKVYLDDRISANDEEREKAFDNYDLHDVFLELMSFCKWWDGMYDTEDDHVLIYREE